MKNGLSSKRKRETANSFEILGFENDLEKFGSRRLKNPFEIPVGRYLENSFEKNFSKSEKTRRVR